MMLLDFRDVTADGGFSHQLIDVMDKKKKVTKMPNPTFAAGEMEALFSQEKEIARRVLYN
jgi:hypothetical protein